MAERPKTPIKELLAELTEVCFKLNQIHNDDADLNGRLDCGTMGVYDYLENYVKEKEKTMSPEYEALYLRTVKLLNALLMIQAHTQDQIDPITGEYIPDDTAWARVGEICRKAISAKK